MGGRLERILGPSPHVVGCWGSTRGGRPARCWRGCRLRLARCPISWNSNFNVSTWGGCIFCATTLGGHAGQVSLAGFLGTVCGLHPGPEQLRRKRGHACVEVLLPLRDLASVFPGELDALASLEKCGVSDLETTSRSKPSSHMSASLTRAACDG